MISSEPITQEGSLQSAAAAATESTESVLGKEDFLRLLVAQLENQDPLQPMDNTEFITQLSQFSSLEQMISMNDSLEALTLSQSSASDGQLAAWLGKEVEFRGDTLRHPQSGPASIPVVLSESTQETTVDIRNSSGQVVRELDVGPRSAGQHTIAWDGRDSAGNLVSADSYLISVRATNSEGAQVEGVTRMRGTIDGVSYTGRGAVLEVNGSQISLDDVLAVRQPDSSTSDQDQ